MDRAAKQKPPHLHFTNGQPVVSRLDDWRQDPRFAYLEWLDMEAKLLRIEMWPNYDPNLEYAPINTFARSFHFPVGERWQDCEPPSNRATRVLQAAGVKMPA